MRAADVMIQDSQGTQVRRGDWRTQVIRTIAVIVAAYAPVPVFLGLLRDSMVHLPLVAPVAVVFVAALCAALARGMSVAVRATIIGAPLVVVGSSAAYFLGPTPAVVLVFVLVTIVVGLVRGVRAGAAALIVTGACIGFFGGAARATGDALTGVSLAATYIALAGVPLVAVTGAVRRVEHALDDVGLALAQAERLRMERERARATLRASDERLRLTLEAASVATWSLHAASRAFVWDEGNRGTTLDLPFAAPPDTLDELLARVPEEERGSVAAAFDDVLARRAPELHVEHRLAPAGGPPVWVEARGRLVRIGNADVLVGTVVDVTERRRQEERTALARAQLLRLSTSDALAHGDLSAGLREITEVGSAILDVDRCGVWLFSADGASLEGVDLYHRDGGHERGPLLRADAYPVYFDALGRQRTVAADDARTDERTREFAGDYLEQRGIAAMLDSPIHVGGRMVGVLCHEHATPRRWTPDDEGAAASLADLAARALEAAERASAERRLKLAYEQLGQVTRRLEAVREEERRAIARELHDELGQTLTAVKLSLGIAARDPALAAPRLAETIAIVDRALHATRELLRAIRPPLLDEVGLVPALQAFLDEQSRLSGLEVRLDARVGLPRPPAEIETAAFRLVQEAVTNVLRHSGARCVTVELSGSERLAIVVTDDGRGFEADEVLGRVAADGHLGLVGMRERVRALGGSFGLTTSPGAGTQVRAELPVGGAA